MLSFVAYADASKLLALETVVEVSLVQLATHGGQLYVCRTCVSIIFIPVNSLTILSLNETSVLN